MTIIQEFKPFIGEHCETVTTGNLLKHAGLSLSEPMLFGIGQGLGFGIFAMKNMPAPFLGGRVKNEEVTKNAAANLGIEVEYRQTRSRKKAWDNLATFIDAGTPVGAKLDCYFLDYFTSGVHFAAHYVAVFGYDDDQIHVVDTAQQGGVQTTSRILFEDGRLWKGPMASNALTWTVNVPTNEIDWPTLLCRAIRANAIAYLTPPIRNFGAVGIRKAAALAPSWGNTIVDAPTQLSQMGMLIESAGTGGGLFRKIYRDFLKEANGYLRSDLIEEASQLFGESGAGWSKVADLLGQFENDTRSLEEVAQILLQIADVEEKSFNLLASF